MLRSLLSLAVAPLFGFPLFAGALVFADSLVGEGLFLYQLSYEPRLLATQFLQDAAAALPFTYLTSAVIIAVGFGLHRAGRTRHLLRELAIVGALAGIGLGLVLARSPLDPGTWALGGAGLLFAGLLALPLRSLLNGKSLSEHGI